MPLASVAAAIADGRARPNVRDLAGWVVSLLRAHRDYGWTIAPPAPAPDSPEALRAAFVRYTAQSEQNARSELPEQGATVVADDGAGVGGDEQPPDADRELRSPEQLWNAVQSALRLRLTRTEYTRWLAPAELLAVAEGIATVGVPSLQVREEFERYTSLVCEQLAALCGAPMRLRLLIGADRQSSAGAGEGAPAAADMRPEWVDAQLWVALPAMLRAALIGSALVGGAVQAASPHLAQLLAARYAREIAALLAANRTAVHTAPANTACTAGRS